MSKTKKVKSVQLIASGYEFVCPRCDTFNRVIEVTETVTCKKCYKTFEVQGGLGINVGSFLGLHHHHAIG